MSIVYQEESTNRHVNIAGCPRNELANHERGRCDTRTKRKWRMIDPDSTAYHIRWTDATSMHRGRSARMILELETAGGVGIYDNLGDCRNEFAHVDNGGEVQRGGRE